MRRATNLIHKSTRRTATTKTVRETEAEAIAFVIGTDHRPRRRKRRRRLHPALPRKRGTSDRKLEVIKQTSALILSAIENPAVLQEQTEEKPDEQPSTTQDATDAATAEVA